MPYFQGERERERSAERAQALQRGQSTEVVVLMVDIDSVSYSHPYFIVEEDTGGGRRAECALIKFRGVVYAQK